MAGEEFVAGFDAVIDEVRSTYSSDQVYLTGHSRVPALSDCLSVVKSLMPSCLTIWSIIVLVAPPIGVSSWFGRGSRNVI